MTPASLADEIALRDFLKNLPALPTLAALPDPDALLPEAQSAELLGVTPRALQAWRQRGGGPAFVRISARCIRYRRKDLLAWAASRLRSSTSDPGQPAGEAA